MQRTAWGAGVSRLGYTYAGQTATYDPYAASGLVAQAGYRAIRNDFRSLSDELRVTRDFELAGKHSLTAGMLLSRYKSTMNMRFQDFLLELAGKPRPLDLVAYDAGGNVLGRVTDNGVLRYASTLTGGESTVTQTSVFVADTWRLAPQTTLDIGARRSGYKGDGFSRNTARYDLGNGATLADNSTLGFTGVNAPRAIDGHPTSWTVGVNQQLTPSMGVYARASVAYRLPGESDERYRERLDAEARVPRDVLERGLQGKVDMFAYPYGDTTEALIDVLRKRDYRLAVTVNPGGNAFFADPLLLRRSMVLGDQDLETFKAKLQTYRQMDPR